jgi:hypothetical protein
VWEVTFGLLSNSAVISAVISDGIDNSWAQDFRRNGPDPVMRDFVDLEMAIKTRLLDSPDTSQRLRLEQVLATGLEPGYLAGLFYASIGRLAAYQPEVRHTPAELLGTCRASCISAWSSSAAGRSFSGPRAPSILGRRMPNQTG